VVVGTVVVGRVVVCGGVLGSVAPVGEVDRELPHPATDPVRPSAAAPANSPRRLARDCANADTAFPFGS
jgi:hypothetical protein